MAAATEPTWAQLEAQAARVGTIRVVVGNVFNPEQPLENNVLYRTVNRLHVLTREHVIERALLFKPGDRVRASIIEESERLLRRKRFLNSVQIVPMNAAPDSAGNADAGRVVDIEVRTRDTWSLDASAQFSRAGGASALSARLKDFNFLGTGAALSYERNSTVERSGQLWELRDEQLLGSWVTLQLSHGTYSDGHRTVALVERPFYALDTRWALGVQALDHERVDTVYAAGLASTAFGRRERVLDVYGGWSQGRVNGWVQRAVVGISGSDDRYTAAPDRRAPDRLASDERLVGPYLRYAWIEDRFATLSNRNVMGRPESFPLGLAAQVQVGLASRALGSTHDARLVVASISRGFTPAPEHTVLASAGASAQHDRAGLRRTRAALKLQYFGAQASGPFGLAGGVSPTITPESTSFQWLLYASSTLETLSKPNPNETMTLGGDNGLRGYPLRFQNGQRRALFTLEERVYTDWYLWQIFRVGGAVFVDVGRAWGGEALNTATPGWLANAGLGMRFVNTRAAFANVLHLDVAVPWRAAPTVKRVQWSLNTRVSF
jgi:hypothetical protein